MSTGTQRLLGYHRFYGALLGRNGSPWSADRMRATLAGMVAEYLPLPGAWWLEHGRPLPPRRIAERSAWLAAAVIAEAWSWNVTDKSPQS